MAAGECWCLQSLVLLGFPGDTIHSLGVAGLGNGRGKLEMTFPPPAEHRKMQHSEELHLHKLLFSFYVKAGTKPTLPAGLP